MDVVQAVAVVDSSRCIEHGYLVIAWLYIVLCMDVLRDRHFVEILRSWDIQLFFDDVFVFGFLDKAVYQFMFKAEFRNHRVEAVYNGFKLLCAELSRLHHLR